MKSKASVVIAVLIIMGYFAMQAALLFTIVPLTGELGTIITGSVKAIEGLTYIVVGFYFGSSEGSQRKDEFKHEVQQGYQRNVDEQNAAAHYERTFGGGDK